MSSPAMKIVFLSCCIVGAGLLAPTQPAVAAAQPYTVVRAGSEEVRNIVFYWDGKRGVDWEAVSNPKMSRDTRNADPEKEVPYYTGIFLQEAVQRMTGKTLPIVSSDDLSSGIIFTTLATAPSDIKDDPEVQAGLRDLGNDAYNANEAFYVRSQPKRTFIVANTTQGFIHGAVELLDSVDYQVLAMGPNWIHAPKHPTLTFNAELTGRPGFYTRHLNPTQGQEAGGIGTLNITQAGKLTDPTDEIQEKSYDRWRAGTHMMGRSIPKYIGHALDNYHAAVLRHMIAEDDPQGLLIQTTVDPDAARPPAGPENKGQLWVNQDPKGTPEYGKAFISDGTKWVQQASVNGFTQWVRSTRLDLSLDWVRKIVLDVMEAKASAGFLAKPDDLFSFGTEPEDGGVSDAAFTSFTAEPNWYPEYRAVQAPPQKWGKFALDNATPRVLPNQEMEMWGDVKSSPSRQANSVFAFNNWLLREYDKYIDSLPTGNDDRSTTPPSIRQNTSTGKSKKQLIRTSLFSYNFHDVPPEFNLDPRIRVSIAAYPKHRGTLKWSNYKTDVDIARAFKRLVPNEPSAAYWILSYAPDKDDNMEDIIGSPSVAWIYNKVTGAYRGNIRSIDAEIDFNNGKLGMQYYLYTVLMYKPEITLDQLESYRTAWLNRAFGTGKPAELMGQYYDLMTPDKWVNAPSFWGQAVDLIDQADVAIPDGTPEQARLDDVKQFWYFYYLLDSGKTGKDPEFREFVWKGQMSYQTGMTMVTRRIFRQIGSGGAVLAAGPDYAPGPAHYTHEETQRWWKQITTHWPKVNPNRLAGLKLADGTSAADIDLNDLVQVAQFQALVGPKTIQLQAGIYDTLDNFPYTFLTTAKSPGSLIGGHLFWRYIQGEQNSDMKSIPYGVELYDPATKQWQKLVDYTSETILSHPAVVAGQEGPQQLATIAYKAPRAGLYRVTVGPHAGESSLFYSLDFDPASGENTEIRGQASNTVVPGGARWADSDAWLYVPKLKKIDGTAINSFDVEIWDAVNAKTVYFYTGLPGVPGSGAGGTNFHKTRSEVIPAGFRGLKTLALEPGEVGSLIRISNPRWAYTVHMYTLPQVWAMPYQALLVPRAIAKADGLTPIAP